MKRYLLLSTLLVACGGRPAAWDESFEPTTAVGLNDSVAVADRSLDRVLLLSSPSPLELDTRVLPVGKNVATMQASPDGKRLLVLSRGVQPRTNPEDEHPRLTVIDTEGGPRVSREYHFDDPLSGMVLDPELEWAVLYATDDGTLVTNPNEIWLVNLQNPEEEPQPLTIRSLGSSPRGFVFTSTLNVPNGDPRRLLVVQTEHEVTLVDLSQRDAMLAETQVTLPGLTHAPTQVVFHDRDVVRDPEDGQDYPVDPHLAVRMEGDSTVLLLPLAPPSAGSDRPFRLDASLVEVGGTPSSIEFVRTEYGVRLVALAGGSANLVDPRTSNVTSVTLPKQYTQISRVTEDLDSGAGADIALLWSANVNSLGLWNLGAATSTTSRGLSSLEIGTGVKGVRDIPGDAHPTVKLVEGLSGNFYVLDLATRESSPMLTNSTSLSLSLAPDGQRLWAFLPGESQFTSVNLDDLHPVTVSAQRPIQSVFDVSSSTGGRSALVLHQSGSTLGVTVFNALKPDGAETRFYGGLIYGGMIHE